VRAALARVRLAQPKNAMAPTATTTGAAVAARPATIRRDERGAEATAAERRAATPLM
jgi:hypothetical protein